MELRIFTKMPLLRLRHIFWIEVWDDYILSCTGDQKTEQNILSENNLHDGNLDSLISQIYNKEYSHTEVCFSGFIRHKGIEGRLVDSETE